MDTNELFLKTEKLSFSSSQLNFDDRQKELFSQLDTAEVQVKRKIYAAEDESNEKLKIESSVRPQRCTQFRGQESIFRKPDIPIRKNHRRERYNTIKSIPDYCKNPHKWTKYSLDDVSSEQTSDRANANAAFSFLRELKRRKEASDNENPMTSCPEENKPHFFISKKHTRNERVSGEDVIEKTPSFANSKMILPEYVVGQKKAKASRHSETGKPREKPDQKLKLSHLFEEDD